MLSYVMLCYIVLYCIMLYYIMLYYMTLYDIIYLGMPRRAPERQDHPEKGVLERAGGNGDV